MKPFRPTLHCVMQGQKLKFHVGCLFDRFYRNSVMRVITGFVSEVSIFVLPECVSRFISYSQCHVTTERQSLRLGIHDQILVCTSCQSWGIPSVESADLSVALNHCVCRSRCSQICILCLSLKNVFQYLKLLQLQQTMHPLCHSRPCTAYHALSYVCIAITGILNHLKGCTLDQWDI